MLYHEQNGLVPVPEPIGAITRDNWREFLGQREREADYRTFFAGEVARLGATPAALLYLPELIPGMAASATHAFMRMAYATMTDSDEETGVAARLLGCDLSFAWALARPHALDRRSGRGSRVHVRPGRRSVMSSPSAISCGTSCARCRRSRNSRLSSICSRSGRRPMTAIARCSLSALCRDARLLRIACGHGHALAEAHGAAHARRGDAAALFLAGHRIAGPEDRLSRSARARMSWRHGGALACPTGPRSIARRSRATTSMI